VTANPRGAQRSRIEFLNSYRIRIRELSLSKKNVRTTQKRRHHKGPKRKRPEGRSRGLPGQNPKGIATAGPTLRGISQVAMGARCARYRSSPQRAGRPRRESCQSRRSCQPRRRHAIQGGSDGMLLRCNVQTCTCGNSAVRPLSAALPQYSQEIRGGC
jgi:hypothetical protein